MSTDAECKNAICPPGKKQARLPCSGGPYLEVSPSGSKRWFWKYRKDGKEGRMGQGRPWMLSSIGQALKFDATLSTVRQLE